MSSDALERAKNLAGRVTTLWTSLGVDQAIGRQKAAEDAMATAGFWEKPEEARRPVVEDLKLAKMVATPMLQLRSETEDLVTLAEMVASEGGEEDLASIEKDLARAEVRVDQAELQAMLQGPDDARSCYLSIQAGAGGTDACDFAEMLLRMYRMYLERRPGFKAEIIDIDHGEEAGIKSAIFHVTGPYAFGYLQGERGVHRLVRISPFDSQQRRHTSFAAVDLVPEFEDDVEIELVDKDLRVDTYRSGGAGGQHVNVTDSAVRITHIPTGVVVACQNERSQHANRRVAMKLLKAKLYNIERDKREDEQAKVYGEKGEIAWGRQIRSYVQNPYSLVKDLRTDVETNQVQEVLDGALDPFIDAYLRTRIGRKPAPKAGTPKNPANRPGSAKPGAGAKGSP